jgi:CubicO group peptidase (beta-lactamase class C family)
MKDAFMLRHQRWFRRLLPLFFVLPLPCFAQTAAPAAASTDERARFEAFVDGVVSTLGREHGVPAVAVSVVKDDALWLAKGYGMADLAAARPVVADASLFRIGSVSKTFIWTAVMMLVERGKLDLKADVNTYLKVMRVDAAFGQPVTLLDLMHHRAGFEDTLQLFTVGDTDPRTLNELLVAHHPRRVFAPGARTSYSNWGAALAAQIVEDAAGVPYADVLKREILDPLGMRNTTWGAPAKMDEAHRAALATGYKKGEGALAVQGEMQLGAYWPAGGIASSAADMARWMRFHLKGGELEGVRLLRADTHAQMWTRAFTDRPAANDVAHGFQDRSYRGLRTLGHAGGTATFLTNMILVPELGLGVFVSQSSTLTATPMNLLPDQIIDRFAAQTTTAAATAALEVQGEDAGPLAEFDGTYLPNRRSFRTFSTVFSSIAAARVTALSPSALRVGSGGTSKQFRPVVAARDTFEAADGSRIAFLRDDASRVVALADSAGVHTLERVAFWASPTALFLALGIAVLLSVTTLLGWWRRFGWGSSEAWVSTLAALSGVIAAFGVLGFALGVGVMAAGMLNVDLSALPGNYPTLSMFAVHYAGGGVVGLTALMLVTVLPMWWWSGWRLLRRLHFTLFTLVLLCLAFLLWHWKVIGAPVL